RSSTSDPVKRINFYTATSFEGSDIYDKEGHTLVVSDGRYAYTLLDIRTKLQQIAGRIRDSKYKKTITQIYKSNAYKVSEKDFEAGIEKKRRKEATTANVWNNALDTTI